MSSTYVSKFVKKGKVKKRPMVTTKAFTDSNVKALNVGDEPVRSWKHERARTRKAKSGSHHGYLSEEDEAKAYGRWSRERFGEKQGAKMEADVREMNKKDKKPWRSR